MKKVISLLLIMILFLSGCSASKNDSLANYNFKLSRIADSETKKVLFSNEKNNAKYDGAEITDLSFSANKNEIILKDNETGNEWSLGYARNKTAETNNPDGVIYDITYTGETGTIKGYATTGIANLNNESGSNYLIISVGGYDLHFTDIEENTLN